MVIRYNARPKMHHMRQRRVCETSAIPNTPQAKLHRQTAPRGEQALNDELNKALSELSETVEVANLAMTVGRQVVEAQTYAFERSKNDLVGRLAFLEQQNAELRATQEAHNRRVETIAVEAKHEEQTRVRQVLERHLSLVGEASVKARLERLMAELQK